MHNKVPVSRIEKKKKTTTQTDLLWSSVDELNLSKQ